MRREFLFKWLSQLLYPLIRLCVHNSIRFQDLIDAIKSAYIDVIREMHGGDENIPNVTQISLMTGIHRAEVKRLLETETAPREKSFIARIIGQWQSDRRFCKKGGETKILTCNGQNSEFGELAASVSKSLTPYSILLELERRGIVRRKDGAVELLQPMYRTTEDWNALFRVLSADTDDLYRISVENMSQTGNDTHLHIRTFYDNIIPRKLPELKMRLLQEGTEFHRRMQSIIASYDKDANPELAQEQGGGRISLTTFSSTQ